MVKLSSSKSCPPLWGWFVKAEQRASQWAMWVAWLNIGLGNELVAGEQLGEYSIVGTS